jgi:DNA-3-methyladenine glycosylase II
MEKFNKNLESACTHLAANDPVLKLMISRYGKPTITPHDNYYEELVSSIISQQLSVKAANTIWKRFINIYNDTMPTPENIIDTDIEILRGAGISYAKVNYIKDLANHIVNHSLDLSHIAELPNDLIIEQLTAVKGIGEWSAHMFMIFSLGRLNVLPWGDLGIKNSIKNNYGLSELPTKNIIVEISESNFWNPYESVAAWYLWKSLDNKG